MTRWQPGARGRLEQAAMELYLERGFGQTTVAQIAERAGVTERTFFRYFADKREMLFDGSGRLQQLMVDAVAAAPATATPSRRSAPHSRPSAPSSWISTTRAPASSSSPPMHRCRNANSSNGSDWRPPSPTRCEPAASANRRPRSPAHAGIGVFHVAFAAWIAPGNSRSYAVIARELLIELSAIARGR